MTPGPCTIQLTPDGPAIEAFCPTETGATIRGEALAVLPIPEDERTPTPWTQIREHAYGRAWRGAAGDPDAKVVEIVTTRHPWTVCKALGGLHQRYSGKTWSDAFQCPCCGARRRYNTNFLGTRRVVCNGAGKFLEIPKVVTFGDIKKAQARGIDLMAICRELGD